MLADHKVEYAETGVWERSRNNSRYILEFIVFSLESFWLLYQSRQQLSLKKLFVRGCPESPHQRLHHLVPLRLLLSANLTHRCGVCTFCISALMLGRMAYGCRVASHIGSKASDTLLSGVELLMDPQKRALREPPVGPVMSYSN